jgi:hypothetical protein
MLRHFRASCQASSSEAGAAAAPAGRQRHLCGGSLAYQGPGGAGQGNTAGWIRKWASQLQESQKENARLKRLVADQALDNQILREAARPNW